MEKLSDSLLTRLLTAEVCCKDCGTHFGKYSVGCSSSWYGNCHVCGKYKSVTEVRDWGYLTKGIQEEKAKIAEQSAEVAKHMAEQENEPASYEQGQITCMFTEDEIGFLNECLDTIQEFHPTLTPYASSPEEVALFESIAKKLTELYEDYCVKYQLSPALIAYHAKYGTWGTESPEEEAKWQGFLDAYNLLNNNNN